MEQLVVFVIGPRNSGKSKLISTSLSIPINAFKKNSPFEEYENGSIPITFIEANNVTIDELQQELETRQRKSSIHLCWHVLPGEIAELTQQQINVIKCIEDYFEGIIYVFTDVVNTTSSKYKTMLSQIVEDPAIVLLPSCDNSNTVMSFDTSFTELIAASFSVIPQHLHKTWQLLVDLRQQRIYHGVENKPERINFHGIDVLVQDTDIGHINIILAGKSGSGKSTLINTIIGKEVSKEGVGNSVTHKIEEFNVENMPITIIDSPGFELGDNQQNLKNIFKLIDKRKQTKDISKHIHLMWYCINEQEYRVQNVDNNVVKEISKIIPVFIVLTNSIQTLDYDSEDPKVSIFADLKMRFPGAATYSDYFELIRTKAKKIHYIKLSKSNIAIHRIVAKPIQFDTGDIQCAYGLSEFLDLHKYYIPNVTLYVLNSLQEIDFEDKKKAAMECIDEFSRQAGHLTSKPIRAKDAYRYKPQIQNMILEISRLLGLQIQGGSIEHLTDNLLTEKENKYDIFKDIIGYIMGIAEDILSPSGNVILRQVGKLIGTISNIIFPPKERLTLDKIMKSIGTNFLETISTLKSDDKEINIENFMQTYTQIIELRKQNDQRDK